MTTATPLLLAILSLIKAPGDECPNACNADGQEGQCIASLDDVQSGEWTGSTLADARYMRRIDVTATTRGTVTVARMQVVLELPDGNLQDLLFPIRDGVLGNCDRLALTLDDRLLVKEVNLLVDGPAEYLDVVGVDTP